MTGKNNAVCDICGKEYYVCLSCSNAMKLHPFKSFTDTAEHFKVFQAVNGFLTGVYTKEEFKSKLQNIDLSDLDSYKKHIQTLIKDALKEDDVVEVEVPIIEEVATEEMVIEKPVYSRKRNYKVNDEVVETE